MLNMVRVRNRFMVVWGVDSNLRVRLFCDVDRDVFINGSANDLSPILPIKVGNVSSAPNKTDSYQCA